MISLNKSEVLAHRWALGQSEVVQLSSVVVSKESQCLSILVEWFQETGKKGREIRSVCCSVERAGRRLQNKKPGTPVNVFANPLSGNFQEV